MEKYFDKKNYDSDDYKWDKSSNSNNIFSNFSENLKKDDSPYLINTNFGKFPSNYDSLTKIKEINPNYSKKLLSSLLENSENPPFDFKKKNQQQDELFEDLAGIAKKHPFVYPPLIKDNPYTQIWQPGIQEQVEEIAKKLIELEETPAVGKTEVVSPDVAEEVEVAALPDLETEVQVAKPKIDLLHTKFKTFNPHGGDPSLYTKVQARASARVAKALWGVPNLTELQVIGYEEDSIQRLAEIGEAIDKWYDSFAEKAMMSPDVSEVDKKDINGGDVIYIEPLIAKVKNLVARYIVQTSAIDPDYVPGADIGQVLQAGFEAFLTAHKVDIPLYDKVYEEFDELRAKGRSPQEVYLGRDGIYAFVGRKAMDVSRRRKMDPEDRIALREAGTPSEVRPKYLVYPRYYRDYLDAQTKRAYLESQGVTPEADPFFYDTGYTGTIPIDIMNALGLVWGEDYEQRIRLLSTNYPKRRVKGVEARARKEIVDSIEYNAKLDEPSTGIFYNPETEEVRPISKPTSPFEQFTYMMVREAIVRHYYLQEALSQKPKPVKKEKVKTSNHSFAFEEGFLDLMPDEFLENPDAFIEDNCIVLKSSHGEGEYLNELVVLLTLKNGDQVVVKKLEIKKAGDPKNEYRVLQRAKAADLPAPRPVGFVEGQSPDDSSYLIMTKIEGVSGRKFEKELRKSGQYSETQIQAILRSVYQKNKETAKMFRDALQIDKEWRIKDLMIDFDNVTGIVKGVTAIDFERSRFFNPAAPKYVEDKSGDYSQLSSNKDYK